MLSMFKHPFHSSNFVINLFKQTLHILSSMSSILFACSLMGAISSIAIFCNEGSELQPSLLRLQLVASQPHAETHMAEKKAIKDCWLTHIYPSRLQNKIKQPPDKSLWL
jgi:hypothetical protein